MLKLSCRRMRNTMKILKKVLKYLLRFSMILIALIIFTIYLSLPLEKANEGVSTRKLNKRKYILVWTEGDGIDWEFFKQTDTTFKENKCEYDNCYVTTNRKYFDKDYTKFDAVLFDSKFVFNEGYRLPKRRSPKQIYIFASKDSAANNPACDPKFDGLFNLTWTYKLNSDVPWPYFTVYDHENKEVAPKKEVKWVEIYKPALQEYELLVAEKQFAAIWISSNCFTSSRRETLYNKLSFSLKQKNLKVDSVGDCGIKMCPIDLEFECLKHMYRYHFFFAFENALAEDYVTEKILKAYRNYIVPVVFGDADYNKFLPPHSYINALKLGPARTTAIIEHLMKNTTDYLDYFRWRNHYRIEVNDYHVCKLCELLNKDVAKVYNDFRNWWNPKTIKSFGAKPKRVC